MWLGSPSQCCSRLKQRGLSESAPPTMTPDEYIDAGIGWLLDTFGPWSPAVLLVVVATVLIGMAVSMAPTRKSQAEIDAENAKLRELGFDERGMPLDPQAHLSALQQQLAEVGSDEESEYDTTTGFIMDEEESGSDGEGHEAEAATVTAAGSSSAGTGADDSDMPPASGDKAARRRRKKGGRK